MKGVPYRGRIRRVGNYGRYNKGWKQEVKYFDVSVSVDPVGTSGSIVSSINLIPEGTDPSERIGRKIVVRSLHCKSRLQLDHTTGDSSSCGIVRIMWFVDKQTNGAAATVLDILNSADWDSFRNMENGSRFQILSDKTHFMNKTSGAGDGATNDWPQYCKNYKFNKRCNIPITFDGATGALTEICCNNIGLLLITESTASVPSFLGKVRVRYMG